MDINKVKERIKKLDEEAEMLRKQVEEMEELERLTKLLEEKEQEVNQLRAKIKKYKSPTFKLPPVTKKITPIIISAMVVLSVILFTASATAPVVSYANPSNGATLVDVITGQGVNYTVNVTDSDGDLQQVILKDNASGSWVTFYDSGSLGGVSYHNHSGTNSHWRGSTTKYYWQICAKDGSGWTNTTFSFTTGYAFGEPQLVFGDFTAGKPSMRNGIVYKGNNYWLFASNSTTKTRRDELQAKRGSSAFDWCRRDKELVDYTYSSSYDYYIFLCNAFTYNNIDYVYYVKNGRDLRYAGWNGTAWETGDTGVDVDTGTITYTPHAMGADVKYYDGEYILVYDYYDYPTAYLKWATSTNPLSSFTTIGSLDSEDTGGSGEWSMPSLEIFDGKLVCVYKEWDQWDLHWKVYDGVNWVDKGDIDTDIQHLQGTSVSLIKDPVNHQLVVVYVNATTGNIYYRVLTDPSGTWSEPHLIFTPVSGKTVKMPFVEYIDRRLIITFAYNLRGNYNIYSISAPDYTMTSGLNETYNRIVFPDATPTATHVNSTVFAIKNINDRDILNITWHVSNIGDITAPNNVKVWTNMSGSWVGYLVGSDGNTSEIDISALKGSEWQPGETTYWKLEILDMGGVAETLHATDEDIYYWVDLGT